MIAPDFIDTPEHLREQVAEAQEAIISIARDLGLGITGGPDDIRAEIMRAIRRLTDERNAWRSGDQDRTIEADNLRRLLRLAAPHVEASAGASHLLDGFRPRVRPLDALVEEIRAALTTEGAQA